MTPEQITTIIASIFGYGGVALGLERLRREFIAYKKEQEITLVNHKARIETLENKAA